MIITRSANVYGEGQQLYRIIPRTFICCLTGQKLQLHGGGLSLRTFIHFDDVSRALMLICEKGNNGTDYHICTKQTIMIRELVSKVCKSVNVKFDNVIPEKLQLRFYQPVLFSLLYNIFSNSLKAFWSRERKQAKGDRIQVKIMDLQKEKLSLFFSDNSDQGISPEDAELLFEKRISRTQKQGGKGLGLYSLKLMLNALDGDMEIVKPIFGTGTTIKVTIPTKYIER